MPTCEICQKPAAWQKDKKMKKGGHWKKRNGVIVCAAHATNWDRYKNFDLVSRNRPRKDVVGAGTLHDRIRSHRGAAKTYLCECGRQAYDWCLLPGTKDTIFDDYWTPPREYSLDINNYIPMCRSCHRFMDNEWKKEL